MNHPKISFRLKAPGNNADGNEYRVPVLPRAGEYFEDGFNLFRVTHVVHRAYGIIDVHAVKDSLSIS